MTRPTGRPESATDFIALELATDHALAGGLRPLVACLWALRSWWQFIREAEEPAAQARYRRLVEKEQKDFEAYWAYCTMLAGPCPKSGTDAEKEAWLDRLDQAEAELGDN